MLTVMSAMAQQESENISSHVKLGLQMKQKRGELIGYNGCLGYVYDKDTKEISINYEEAEIVRYIYEKFRLEQDKKYISSMNRMYKKCINIEELKIK